MPAPDPLSPATSIVVQASAGTGKTWLLTSRLIRLLVEGAVPPSILAITFTRQAAAEMQQRVSQRLADLALCPPEKLDTSLRELGISPNDHARTRARNLYETLLTSTSPFRIKTFHAFSQELLHRFPLEASVPPGFTLSEQTRELERAAWDALERELTRQPDGPVARAMDVLLRGVGLLQPVRASLYAFLEHRSDWQAYIEDEPDPLRYATEQLRLRLQIGGRIAAGDLIADKVVRSDLADYAALLQRHPTPTNTATAARVAEAVAAADRETAFSLLRTVFLTQDGQPRHFRTSATLTKQLGAAGAARLQQLHASLASRIQAAERMRRRCVTAELSQAWYTCGMRLLEHYQSLKRQQNLLDFADLEWFAYRLLSAEGHAEWVQYKLDERIDHLLVDEFQDTNPTQWRLLQPLLAELAAGSPERTRSVFLVGDAKQSIYRFRRAEPQLFDAARDWLTHAAGAHVVTQDVSWRSSPAVLAFVDLLFRPGDEAAAYALSGYRPHGARHDTLWGRVELLPLVRRTRAETTTVSFRNPLTTPRLLEEDERHYHEGQIVAGRIAELLGHPIGHDARPLGYGDVIILLRDRTHAPDYELALRHAGIPYAGADRGNLINCLEVRDLIHLLTILLVPDDNLALASVLRSPLFGATHEDLLRLAEGEEVAWYDRLMTMSTASSGALQRAQRLLPRWRQAVDRVPVHDLLDRIYCEGDVLARYASAAPPHLKDRVTAQLNRLLVLALEADSGRFPSLARFIDRLPTLTADDYVIGPGTDQGDRVRLMTIHAAKGLEAPVVFLVNAAQQDRNRDRGPRALIEWPAGAPRPDTFQFVGRKSDIDDISAEIADRIDVGYRHEESNLLYVALTRAQQVLYISGCESGRANGDAGQRRGWYGFIESRLAAAARDGTTPNLTLMEIADENGAMVNVCGRLEHGVPPPLRAPRTAIAEEPTDIDPALTRPLPSFEPTPTVTHPSRLAGTEDATANPAGDALRETAARRGAIIHRALERLSGSDSAHTATVRAALWQEWAGQISEEEFEAYWAEARGVFDAPDLHQFFDAAGYDQARNEMSMLYAVGGHSVYGVVDRLIWRGEEIVLLDYKTHRLTRAEIPAAVTRLEPQLRLYVEGIKRLWPEKSVRAFVVFTACRQAVEVSR